MVAVVDIVIPGDSRLAGKEREKSPNIKTCNRN